MHYFDQFLLYVILQHLFLEFCVIINIVGSN